MDDNDIIDISMDFENLDNGGGWGKSKKTNFGGGIELLMNEKRNDNAPTSDINIDDLNNLENELNDLANETTPISNNFESGFFGVKAGFDDNRQSVRFDDGPSVGKSTSNTDSDSKTWDGYGKFNNIPINPDVTNMSSEPKLTKEELMREKFKFLRKLEALEKKGV